MRNEFSNNNTGEEAVSRLIGTLDRIEAPKDFEFRLRARIAKGRPVESRVSWFPASVRYAVPLGLVLAAGGYLGLNAIYTAKNADVPAVAQTEVKPAPVSQPMPVATAAPVENIIPPSTIAAAAKNEAAPPPVVNKTVIKEPVKRPTTTANTTEPGGGSIDTALTTTKVLHQRGVSSNSDDQNTPAPTMSSGDALGKIGIHASGAKVESVVPGSAAARSGVKAGDVIESVQGKSIRVLRDGKSVVIGINR